MIFLLLIGFSGITRVFSCMPGYEAERDRLREHLGIEWIPKGLEKSAWSDRPVRNPSDLNCDFSNPEKCRWKNMGDEKHMDSRDFYLFEKVDYTEFPALRVGPGPTKLPQGDKMIFTGDKKREEQHSIFYSSPINCQNSTGNLTFTYWVYNSARVEVILLEDDGKGGYKMVFDDPAEDKPYVDCGTIHLNTECHAEIPPREKPFRIGIRAYGIENTDGSFVMIDNILYSASLCKVGIDVGENFKTTPLETGAMGKHVGSAAELKCDNFDAKCRWRSGGDAKLLFRAVIAALAIFSCVYAFPTGAVCREFCHSKNGEASYTNCAPVFRLDELFDNTTCYDLCVSNCMSKYEDCTTSSNYRCCLKLTPAKKSEYKTSGCNYLYENLYE